MAEFYRYVKSTNEQKIPLIFLLLNGYDITNVQKAEIIKEECGYGITITKKYVITSDFIELSAIQQEFNSVKAPIICSDYNSFEYNSDAKYVYVHYPNDDTVNLCINDMRVIGKTIAFIDNIVISDVCAEELFDDKKENRGFMYFYQYVMNNEMNIHNWKIEFIKSDGNHDVGSFKIHYISKDIEDEKSKPNDEIVYEANNISKNDTYKMVIYIIKKTSHYIKEWLPDNFLSQQYKLKEE